MSLVLKQFNKIKINEKSIYITYFFHLFMHRTEHRVIYADTDSGGVVYYGNYFRWFEKGRAELLRSLKIDYNAIIESGIITPVVEAHCNYFYPARYDDIVVVETRISEIRDKSIKFTNKVLRKKGKKLLAEGYTVNVFVDKDRMKAVKIPNSVRKKLKIG